MKKVLTVLIVGFLFFGCGPKSDGDNPIQEDKILIQTGKAILNISGNLEKVSITRVSAGIVCGELSDSMDLDISGRNIGGTFENLDPGMCDIEIEAFEEADMVATGVGIAEVIAGETTVFDIMLEPIVGDLEINIIWEEDTEIYLQFNAGTDHINVPASDSFLVSEAITIEAWVYNFGGGGVGPRIIEIIDTFALMMDKNTGIVTFHLGWGISLISETSVTGNEWTHLAASWDGSTMYLFIDGVLDNMQPFAGPIRHDGPGDRSLKIGNGWTLIDGFFGYIDEVRFSSIARYTSDFEPANEHIIDIDTVGLWHLDEAEGAIVNDESANNNHGEIVGPVWMPN